MVFLSNTIIYLLNAFGFARSWKNTANDLSQAGDVTCMGDVGGI